MDFLRSNGLRGVVPLLYVPSSTMKFSAVVACVCVIRFGCNRRDTMVLQYYAVYLRYFRSIQYLSYGSIHAYLVRRPLSHQKREDTIEEFIPDTSGIKRKGRSIKSQHRTRDLIARSTPPAVEGSEIDMTRCVGYVRNVTA